MIVSPICHAICQACGTYMPRLPHPDSPWLFGAYGVLERSPIASLVSLLTMIRYEHKAVIDRFAIVSFVCAAEYNTLLISFI